MFKNNIIFGMLIQTIKRSGNKRRIVASNKDRVFSIIILLSFIPLASFHSILLVIFSSCSIDLLISLAKNINKHIYPSSRRYSILILNKISFEKLFKFIKESVPKKVAIKLINIKFQFNIFLIFKTIKYYVKL